MFYYIYILFFIYILSGWYDNYKNNLIFSKDQKSLFDFQKSFSKNNRIFFFEIHVSTCVVRHKWTKCWYVNKKYHFYSLKYTIIVKPAKYAGRLLATAVFGSCRCPSLIYLRLSEEFSLQLCATRLEDKEHVFLDSLTHARTACQFNI